MVISKKEIKSLINNPMSTYTIRSEFKTYGNGEGSYTIICSCSRLQAMHKARNMCKDILTKYDSAYECTVIVNDFMQGNKIVAGYYFDCEIGMEWREVTKMGKEYINELNTEKEDIPTSFRKGE